MNHDDALELAVLICIAMGHLRVERPAVGHPMQV